MNFDTTHKMMTNEQKAIGFIILSNVDRSLENEYPILSLNINNSSNFIENVFFIRNILQYLKNENVIQLNNLKTNREIYFSILFFVISNNRMNFF
jgi:hypothetical protein